MTKISRPLNARALNRRSDALQDRFHVGLHTSTVGSPLLLRHTNPVYDVTVATAQTRYTLKELQAEARARGFNPSERMIKDWIGLGLLDQAQRRGLGRGQGIVATWSENQKELLLQLLAKRGEITRVASLCNIPVFVWLWWGDDYVPTRQALRALSTWAGTQEATSWRRASWTAEQLVEHVAGPGATRAQRKRLIDLIAHTAYGAPFDADAVKAAFDEILDSTYAHLPAPVRMTGEMYTFLVEARLTAVRWLHQKKVELAALTWARAEYLTSRREYQQLLPSLFEADPEGAAKLLPASEGGVVLTPTTEQIANSACLDALTLLGIYLLGIERGRQETG